MKRLFILPVLLFLMIPCAQGQELYGVNRFDLQVSGLGGVKNNVPEIPATDVYPYLGFSGTVTSYIASRENRRHPGIENRHRLGVAFSAYMYDGYADKGLQLGVKYLMPKPPGSSIYFSLVAWRGVQRNRTGQRWGGMYSLRSLQGVRVQSGNGEDVPEYGKARLQSFNRC